MPIANSTDKERPCLWQLLATASPVDSTTPPGSLAASRTGNSIFEINVAGGDGASLDAPGIVPRALGPRGFSTWAVQEGPKRARGSRRVSARLRSDVASGGELCIAISSSTGRLEDLKLFVWFRA